MIGPCSGGEVYRASAAAMGTPKSTSSMSTQPPGRTAASRWATAVWWSGTCSTRARAWTRSNAACSGAPLLMSCVRTSRFVRRCSSTKRVSRSVATTRPVMPTRSASHTATAPAPHPTSRQLHPSVTPRLARWRVVAPSYRDSRPAGDRVRAPMLGRRRTRSRHTSKRCCHRCSIKAQDGPKSHGDYLTFSWAFRVRPDVASTVRTADTPGAEGSAVGEAGGKPQLQQRRPRCSNGPLRWPAVDDGRSDPCRSPRVTCTARNAVAVRRAPRCRRRRCPRPDIKVPATDPMPCSTACPVLRVLERGLQQLPERPRSAERGTLA